MIIDRIQVYHSMKKRGEMYETKEMNKKKCCFEGYTKLYKGNILREIYDILNACRAASLRHTINHPGKEGK